MITNMKREIAAEYDLKLEDILSEDEKNAELLDKVDNMAAKLEDDDKKEQEISDVKEAPKKSAKKKRKSAVPSVIELLDECEDAAKDEASSFGKQLKLDVDALIARTGGETK